MLLTISLFLFLIRILIPILIPEAFSCWVDVEVSFPEGSSLVVWRWPGLNCYLDKLFFVNQPTINDVVSVSQKWGGKP